MDMEEIIKIDGSYGEAGGAILRVATASSAITKKPVYIYNIRRGRKSPGLKTQHLLGLRALSELCQGFLEGDILGSEEIKFYPGKISKKEIHIKIDTAGSITLALQALVPVALFSSEPIKIIFDGGGTDTFFSPTLDYFRFVFLKILEKMTLKTEADINIIKRGYYPTGGAKLEITIYPSKLKKLNLTKRGTLEKILVFSGASEFLRSKKVAERQIAGVREILGKLKLPIEERVEYYQTSCPGSQVCLVAQFENTVLGTDNLGKLGKRAEDVGKEAALELLKAQKTEACLDKHLADQILPYMALSSGKSQVTVSEVTNHCKTNMWVIEKFFNGKFEIEDNLISWNPNKM